MIDEDLTQTSTYKPFLRRLYLLSGIGLVLLGLFAALVQTWSTHAAPALVTQLHTVPLRVAAAQDTGTVAPETPMSVTFTLQPRNRAILEKFVKDTATPHSGAYQQFLTPASFAQNFGPDHATLAAVQQFAQSNGLTITKVQSGGLFITATGKASQISTMFKTPLHKFTDANGQPFYANTHDISLPAAIAHSVTSVTGLENASVKQNHAVGPRSLTPKDQGTSAAGCPATQGTFGLTPPQLATAYNFPTNANGTGERVAIVSFDGYSSSDVAAYAACFAPSANASQIVQAHPVDLSGPLTPGVGAIESMLDIEVVLGMAPGLSKIDFYEAPNTNQGLVDMLATIANDYVDGTVSDSWGSCEADTGFSVAAAEQVAFLQMAAQGQGVYVASGDTGAYSCLGAYNGTFYHSQIVNVDDPSAQPYVVAVGGTTLTQNAQTSSYISEIAWNSSSPNSAQVSGTGGGISQFWSAPTWQTTTGASKGTAQSGAVTNPGGGRVSPDVSADADPATGYAEYCTAGSLCQSIGGGGWFSIGGTSASAPLWAALAATANQLAGNRRIGLITPALYTLYGADTAATSAAGLTLGNTLYIDYAQQVNGASAPGSAAQIFHDVTQGNNTFPSSLGYQPGYNAQRGFDAATGLGTMNASAIANYLANNIRFTSPRIYAVAKGQNGAYWLASYFLNNANGNYNPGGTTGTGWVQLGTQTFQGAPAIANNGVTTSSLGSQTGQEWITGIANDGTVWVGSYTPITMTFNGWVSVPGVQCKNNPAAAVMQSRLYVTCMTPTGGIVMNTYSLTSYQWSGWTTIGGGLSQSPTLATDGNQLVIIARAPMGASIIDWFTSYTLGATPRWRPVLTTCVTAPAITYSGSSQFVISCIAGDTKTMWSNTINGTNYTLSGWYHLVSPTGIPFVNATSLAVDQIDNPSVVFYVGQGANNAAYIKIMTTNPYFTQVAGVWQGFSLAGIFSSNPAIDYFNQ